MTAPLAAPRAAPLPVRVRFVVAGSTASAGIGFAVAVLEIAASTGFRPSAWGIDVLAALAVGFTVGVVFTVASVVVLALTKRFRMPVAGVTRPILLGVAAAAATVLIGLLVESQHPAIWPEWPLVLLPALLGGAASAIAAATDRGARRAG
ncbi:hypothetical protein ACEXQB_012000 [Herbiconiux sp. P18]|uniref:hypothetical protein n=1 Tax=Herbiconiux liangxiaofengii TaxID=3342795 RepID=UPI0035B8F403